VQARKAPVELSTGDPRRAREDSSTPGADLRNIPAPYGRAEPARRHPSNEVRLRPLPFGLVGVSR
jgi:hypothetical protein